MGVASLLGWQLRVALGRKTPETLVECGLAGPVADNWYQSQHRHARLGGFLGGWDVRSLVARQGSLGLVPPR